MMGTVCCDPVLSTFEVQVINQGHSAHRRTRSRTRYSLLRTGVVGTGTGMGVASIAAISRKWREAGYVDAASGFCSNQ